MLTITEKDGATIITIENPSASEQDIIKKAKNAQRVSAWVMERARHSLQKLQRLQQLLHQLLKSLPAGESRNKQMRFPVGSQLHKALRKTISLRNSSFPNLETLGILKKSSQRESFRFKRRKERKSCFLIILSKTEIGISQKQFVLPAI